MTWLRSMRRSIALAGLAGVVAVADAGCSTTPTFFLDGLGGGGGASASSSSSGGAACQTPEDCAGDENECTHRTCAADVCGMDFAPEGFLVGAQTTGDCQKTVCGGKNAVETLADDADKPNDGNACTVDLCQAGKPAHPPAPKGTPCGVTLHLACDGMGSCAGCKADADCGQNTPCAAYACDAASICKITYVPAGQGDPGGQQAGDCKKAVCNGSGGTSIQNDDGDHPNDGNACTQDLCALGQPSHAPAPLGTACGGTFKCDGNGSCAGCVASADCGQSNACAAFACAAGACMTTYVPAGQGDPGGQQAGDCKKNVCNGSGSPMTVADDGDVPSDGNPCTNDACSNGVPSNTPVGAGIGCGGSLKCDGAGNCIGCLSNADCGQATACVSYLCQGGGCSTEFVPYGSGNPGGQVANDCKKKVCDGSGGSTTIADDGDVDVDANACTQDYCSGGAPQHPPSPAGTSCGGPNTCDGGGNCTCSDPGACNGKCGGITDGCGAGIDCGGCPAPQSCAGGGVPNQCGCSDPGACGGKCGGITDACGAAVDCGDPCAAPDSCGGGGTPNVCGCNPCGGSCAHPLCQTGGVLDPNCDSCAGQICGTDPYCCGTSWDSYCVSEVTSICGGSCP